MDQVKQIKNHIVNDIRSRLIEKLNETRKIIILGDKDKLVQILLELELYQKEFDDLYQK
ncbi:hypothetical protein [Photobacterium toruni]|uniref:hypothetical protein n=1 Tax=Photobacterium toruni TaxID=1935446 RepID=UPI00210F5C27|nr:hypothetical protein [Photobacterium toruni]